MKKLLIVININLYLFILGCDKFDNKLQIINNSNDTVCYGFEYTNIIDYRNDVLASRDSINPAILIKWEKKINRDSPDSTIRIFFLEKKIMDKLGRDSVYRGQIYSQKIALKVKDLEKMGWKVFYNPDSLKK